MKAQFIGIVASYDGNSVGRNGTVTVSPYGTIGFCFNSGRCFADQQKDSVRSRGWTDAKVQRDPRPGEELLVEVFDDGSGIRVCRWGYLADADSQEERILKDTLAA